MISQERMETLLDSVVNQSIDWKGGGARIFEDSVIWESHRDAEAIATSRLARSIFYATLLERSENDPIYEDIENAYLRESGEEDNILDDPERYTATVIDKSRVTPWFQTILDDDSWWGNKANGNTMGLSWSIWYGPGAEFPCLLFAQDDDTGELGLTFTYEWVD